MGIIGIDGEELADKSAVQLNKLMCGAENSLVCCYLQWGIRMRARRSRACEWCLHPRIELGVRCVSLSIPHSSFAVEYDGGYCAALRCTYCHLFARGSLCACVAVRALALARVRICTLQFRRSLAQARVSGRSADSRAQIAWL